MKDMYPCSCVLGSRWGEPTQMHIWDSKLLARASSSAAHESRKLIFLVVSTVFSMESNFLYDAEVWKPREKKQNTRDGKNFLIVF